MPINLREVTPTDAAVLAHILITGNDHTFRGLIPDHCLDFSEAESAVNWERTLLLGLPDGDVMLMAVDGDNVVGYVWGGINTKDATFQAELRQLMLLPDYQKRGIGRQMVSAIAQRMHAQGLNSMRVEVLRINPNRPFYEHLGAVYQSEFPYDWEGVSLFMCVYGWPDIRTLLTSSSIPYQR